MALPVIQNNPNQPLRGIVPGVGFNYAIDGGGQLGATGAGTGISEIITDSITSQALHPSLVNVAQVNLTAAQIITLFTAPIILIPAPGAGKSIIIDFVLFRYLYGGVAYTGGGVTTIGYAGGAAAVATVPAATLTAGASSDSTLPTTALTVVTQNAALQISTATANFAAGNGTLQIYIYYSTV